MSCCVSDCGGAHAGVMLVLQLSAFSAMAFAGKYLTSTLCLPVNLPSLLLVVVCILCVCMICIAGRQGLVGL